MKGDTAHPVFCGRRGLLSPLIINRIHINMAALYLVPQPARLELSEGPSERIHRVFELSPSKGDNTTRENEPTADGEFRVDEAAAYLRALNSQDLAVRMLEDKRPDEAIAFADELVAALAIHTSYLKYVGEYITGSANSSLDNFAFCDPKSGWEVSVAKAVERLEEAAAWHRKMGLAGCSVALESRPSP